MTAKPWFKFHIADFRAEMLLLSPAQRSAYISLLMCYWENEGLPDDDYVLAKIAGMRIEDWRRNRASVRRNFTPGWAVRGSTAWTSIPAPMSPCVPDI